MRGKNRHPEDLLDEIPKPQIALGNILDTLIFKEQINRLAEEIHKLDDIYKSVLELKYIAGFTNEKIASFLKIKKKTVEMRLYRANLLLRKIWRRMKMYKNLEDEIWESLLKAAVIENIQNELKDYPSEQEINRIVLPKHYEKRMRKILKHCRYRKNVKLSLRYGKKIASVILVVMGISFTLLLSFDEVRAACQKVIIEIYDRYIRYSYTTDLSLDTTPINLGYVPTGYSMVDASFSGIDNYIVYQNIYGDSIKLNYDTKKFSILIDNEHYIFWYCLH